AGGDEVIGRLGAPVQARREAIAAGRVLGGETRNASGGTHSKKLRPGPEVIFKPMQLFSKATRVLVTAMEKAQVKRLICVTGFGAGDSRGHGGEVRVSAG